MNEPLTLSALYIYPIKSAGGLSLSASELGPRGLTHDRRWMVVSASGRLVTQREFPKLRLIRVALERSGLRVEAPELPTLHLPFQPQGARRQADMWGDLMVGVSVSPEARGWFSDYLGGDFDLLYMPDDVQRWQPDGRPYRSLLGFADGNPFNLITEASLAHLNTHLAHSVTAQEFRPNLVVAGDLSAYAEDGWRRIRVGTVGFEVVESCARCSIVNVSADGRMLAEPLRTLARTRMRGGVIPFGQNLVQDAPLDRRSGTLRVGDVLEVLETGETPNLVYENS
ncbi:MOSC domain-containing protein [Deinococcus sp.]|uniref:MOSC domain-containing protein n=1 Tax=Deinococcus sp. TaxID=47478 RepID=UPI003CC6CB3F